MSEVATLILIPTELERRRLAAPDGVDARLAAAELCGFGPIAAAARTAHLIARRRPTRVLLLGLAGTFDERALPCGAAAVFDAVQVDGIGVGTDENWRSAAAIGFDQWPGEPGHSAAVADRLSLAGPRTLAEHSEGRTLLTVCAATGDAREAAARRARFPHAAAEDMEGFGVALACHLAGVPLAIVRGISNTVGDRRIASWRIDEALAAAAQLAAQMLDDEAWETR